MSVVPRRTTVPRLWPDSTIVCCGAGPSLSAADILYAKANGAKILAVNNAIELCRGYADVLYAADASWWKRQAQVHKGNLAQRLYGFDIGARDHRDDIDVLVRTGQTGLDTRPWALRSGGHSGYSAINLAFHFGPRMIVLLGYDMSPEIASDGTTQHHFVGGDHPDGSHPPYERWIGGYAELTRALAQQNVLLVNSSRRTEISGVPRIPLNRVFGVGAYAHTAAHV